MAAETVMAAAMAGTLAATTLVVTERDGKDWRQQRVVEEGTKTGCQNCACGQTILQRELSVCSGTVHGQTNSFSFCTR
jgi:hypothetical protein